jgi:hypothetical protein
VATETIVRLVDDLDGTNAERTVSFSVDGAGYEIDLSKKNIAALEKALKPFVESARTSGRSRRNGRGRARSRASSGMDLQAIRTWAREHGHTVADRGRIAEPIVEAYRAARG